MARGAQAAIAVGVAVFGFDADPGVSPSRALQVLTVRRTLPRGELGARERFAEAAARVGAEAGVELAPRLPHEGDAEVPDAALEGAASAAVAAKRRRKRPTGAQGRSDSKARLDSKARPDRKGDPDWYGQP